MIATKAVGVLHVKKTIRSIERYTRHAFGRIMWLCLFAACVGTCWFSYQYFLVPQPKSFEPDWQGAQWVQAADATTPVAYFRYETAFSSRPDSAFVTVAANQVFRLYINGYYIGSNASDFVQGVTSRAYMYDVDVALRPGANVIGLRVVNLDNHVPQVRATLGAMWGRSLRYFGTGKGWLATGQTELAHPRSMAPVVNTEPINKLTPYNGPEPDAWATPTLAAANWSGVRNVMTPPFMPHLLVNPLIYTQPLPTHWLSAGTNGSEGYFVRQIILPTRFDEALLRLITTGETTIFINDHPYMTWHGQVPVPQRNAAGYLSPQEKHVLYRKGLALAVYNITPYLHAGKNTIAIHVSSPAASTAKVGLDTLKNAFSLDMLVSDAGKYVTLPDTDNGWHASTHPVAGWTHESSETFQWASPSPVGMPGGSSTYYLPESNTPLNEQTIPPIQLGTLLAGCAGGVLACWLLFSFAVLRRYYTTTSEALQAASLVFLPALALEALLIVLSTEPLLPQPFPYTLPWAIVLVGVVGVSCLLLWLHARNTHQFSQLARRVFFSNKTWAIRSNIWKHDWIGWSEERITRTTLGRRALATLKQHWAIIPVILLAVPMVCYNLTYDPYWQDELASFYAAKGILTHGIPTFPSGILYPKAELFSYIMAFLMALFGNGAVVPRLISLSEYLVSLPLFYFVGCSFFNRKVALLATIMLAFSPYTLIWSREARMYEQALFMVLIVVYVLQWALQHIHRARPPYILVLCILLAYFSHEEVFIILPAILVCVLLGSRKGTSGLPIVVQKKHWWIAALIGVTVIATHLSIVQIFHPRLVGTDQSMRPQIQLTTNNIPFYFHLLFTNNGAHDGIAPWAFDQPLLTVNSLLALLGGLFALRSRNQYARYCALFLAISTATLVFVFTMQADRYFYPLLAIYYLLDAYALWSILRIVWIFARPYLTVPRHRHIAATDGQRLPLLIQILRAGVIACVCAAVLLLPALPLSSYNLFVSRALGVSYRHHYPDYNNAAQYIHSHWHKGDIVVTAAPAVTVLYYVGQADDFFSVNRALFVFERDGHLYETTSGSHPLLNQTEFQTILSTHARIWLISDNGAYEAGVKKDGRFIFPPSDFRMVYEGYGSAVYFRSGG